MIYLFILATTAILAIIFAAHYFLFQSLIYFLGITNQVYLIILKSIFIFLPISFIVASILISRFSNILVRLYYIISASWFGILLYFTLACLLTYFIIWLGKIFSFDINQKSIFISLLITATTIIIYGIIAAQNINKKLNISLPNIPNEWRGKAAVFISDLHLGTIVIMNSLQSQIS